MANVNRWIDAGAMDAPEKRARGMSDIIKDKVAFETKEDRGFKARATYLTEPKGEALIEVLRNGEIVRSFLFPAYKIWNIAAHFSEIVDSELANNKAGYDAAAWTGFTTLPTI